MSSQRQMLLMFAALLPLTLVTFAADKKTKDEDGRSQAVL